MKEPGQFWVGFALYIDITCQQTIITGNRFDNATEYDNTHVGHNKTSEINIAMGYIQQQICQKFSMGIKGCFHKGCDWWFGLSTFLMFSFAAKNINFMNNK